MSDTKNYLGMALADLRELQKWVEAQSQPGERWPALCLRSTLEHLERAQIKERDLYGALVQVTGVLPAIYKKAGFIHIPTDKAIKEADRVLNLYEHGSASEEVNEEEDAGPTPG